MSLSRRHVLRAAAIGAASLVAAQVVPAVAAPPLPPPPPNPSDDDLDAGRAAIAGVDGELAELSDASAAADAALEDSQRQLGLALAEADEANVARDAAVAAAQAAKARAEATSEGQRVADEQLAAAQTELDAFVALGYEQSSLPGSLQGYVGTENPDELLDRAELLDAMSADRARSVTALERASVAKANQDSQARSALEEATRLQQAAEEATVVARAAYDGAVAANEAAASRTAKLLETKIAAEQRLAAAQQALVGLDGQRRSYEQWVVARREAERQAAAEAAAAEQARRESAARAQEQARAQAARDAEADAAAAAAAAEAAANAQGPAPQAPAAPPVQAPAPRAPAQPAAPAPGPNATVAPAIGRLSSTFGPRGGSVHFGVDVANSIGTPIVAVRSGTVISSGPASGFGLWVRLQHGDGTVTVYGHNDYNVVSVGEQVGVGQQIAVIGNRGQSTGPHLHFEVHLGGGTKIDPLPWLAARGVYL